MYPDRDLYGNTEQPPEWTGYEDEDFDGEILLAELLGEDGFDADDE